MGKLGKELGHSSGNSLKNAKVEALVEIGRVIDYHLLELPTLQIHFPQNFHHYEMAFFTSA